MKIIHIRSKSWNHLYIAGFMSVLFSCQIFSINNVKPTNYSVTMNWVIFNNSLDTVAMEYKIDTTIQTKYNNLDVDNNLFSYTLVPVTGKVYQIPSLDSMIIKVTYQWSVEYSKSNAVTLNNFGKLCLFISGNEIEPTVDTLEARINIGSYFLSNEEIEEGYYPPQNDLVIDSLFLII